MGEEGGSVYVVVVFTAVGVEVPGLLSEDAVDLDMEAQLLEGLGEEGNESVFRACRCGDR